MNNFLITGYGRSGTKFLSTVLNKSKEWNIQHEPRKKLDEIQFIQNNKKYSSYLTNYFKKNKYGEVNSYLRYWYKDINLNKKVLLIRNPYNVFLSMANRKKIEDINYYLNNLNSAFSDFKKNLDKFDKIIFFEDITTDIKYIKDLCTYLHINDINFDKINLNKKVNQNKTIKYKSFNELPIFVQQEAKKILEENAKSFNYSNPI